MAMVTVLILWHWQTWALALALAQQQCNALGLHTAPCLGPNVTQKTHGPVPSPVGVELN